MALSCPATALRTQLKHAKTDADAYYAIAKKHLGAGPHARSGRSATARRLRAAGFGVLGVVGAAIAARATLWVAKGTVDNVVAVSSGFGELYRRFVPSRATSDIRSAMESISEAVVKSEDEEQEDEDRVEALAGLAPYRGEFGTGLSPGDDHGVLGGEGGDDGAGPGAQLDPDGAAVDVPGGPAPNTTRKSRRRPNVVVEFSVKKRKYTLDGFWARLAFDAKERFRSVEYSTYSRNCLSKWLDLQIQKAGQVRYVDRRRNLGIIELYVWYVDDAEKDLADAFEELKALGRIRTRID